MLKVNLTKCLNKIHSLHILEVHLYHPKTDAHCHLIPLLTDTINVNMDGSSLNNILKTRLRWHLV
jgi:hypothetical protein